MRNLFIIFSFTLMFVQSNGQDSLKSIKSTSQTLEKKRVHELGLDMTPLIKFYLNFSDNSGIYYQPTYMLSYRRYFKNSNFRSALGGNYLYTETPSPYNGDSLNILYYNKQSYIVFRIGYEFFQNLSKRWQVYYGADAIANYSKQRNDAPSWNGGYANGQENATKGLGLAPVLGIRFKIGQRVSIITESSFLIQSAESSSHRYYLSVDDRYPPKENGPKTTTKTIKATFNYPLALILTLNI